MLNLSSRYCKGFQMGAIKKSGRITWHRRELILSLSEPSGKQRDRRERKFRCHYRPAGLAAAHPRVRDRTLHGPDADARLLFQKSLSHFQLTDLKERYRFVQQHAQKWPVQVVCHVLKLSRSAYYNWLSEKLKSSNQKGNQVQTCILEAFQQHRRHYGFRRIVVELKKRELRLALTRSVR